MTKRAHFYWGNVQLPWLHSLSIRSFIKHHPDWGVILWRPPFNRRCNYPVAAEVVNDFCGEAIVDPQDKTGAMLEGYDHNNAWLQTAWSDALRLWCLHEFGGLYSDCDVLWFKNVETSSLVGSGLRLRWDRDLGLANSLIYASEPEHQALTLLLLAIRAMSPVKQDAGGDTPFGAHLWRDTLVTAAPLHGVRRINTLHEIQPINNSEFHDPPYSVAMHFRAARVLWGGLTPNNWRERTADVPGLTGAIARVLEDLA